MKDLVSILIPAYNAERWIGGTLRSAQRQTWPHLEIIVVDDGSTDRTAEVARAAADARTRVLVQRNAGAAAARNAALRASTGDYVQFLDADDLLAPDKIERQLEGADPGARSTVLRTCAWTRFLSDPERSRPEPDALWTDLEPAEWIRRKFAENRFMFPATWLVSRRLAEAAGPWDERLTLDDDGEYMCRLVRASTAVRFVGAARCHYRVGNTTSLSWTRSERATRSAWLSMQLCIEHLLALRDDDAVRAACRIYLQDNYGLFFPEHAALAEECRALCRRLGGELRAPAGSPSFNLLRRTVGWRNAKRLRAALNRAKWSLRQLRDRARPGHDLLNGT